MSVTINFSKNTSAPWQSNANMLKSTREKIQRQEERDGKIAFFETQKQNLKNQKADTIEEIAKKLEKFHTYGTIPARYALFFILLFLLPFSDFPF